jgi:hypothetical protein
MEAYTANSSAGNSAPFGGRRHRSHGKKLRMVKKKTVRRMLKKMGLKMRGGNPGSVAVTPNQAKAVDEVANGPDVTKIGGGEDEMGGRRRRRSHKRTHRRSHKRSLFGMRY